MVGGFGEENNPPMIIPHIVVCMNNNTIDSLEQLIYFFLAEAALRAFNPTQ